jgi:hypothetical protein
MMRDRRQQFDWEATEVVTGFEGEARVQEARKWCDRHVKMLASPGFTLGMRPASRHVVHTRLLLELAGTSQAGLCLLAPRLGSIARGSDRIPDCDALLAIAALWPVRDEPDRYPEALRAWAAARAGIRCGDDRYGHLAFWIRNLPDLAHALLAGLREKSHRCTECHKPIGECWTARVTLARLAEGLESHPADGTALEAISGDVLLRDDVARGAARQLFAIGREPERLARVVHDALRGEDGENRGAALALALSSPRLQEEAIAMVVSLLSAEPDWPFFYQLSGACHGPGWGRRHLPKKMLPLTRVLWCPSKFSPMHLLFSLVSTEGDAAGWERVRECVAEHLLQLAIEPTETMPVRHAALNAMLELHPGGDGSAVRGLSKLKDNAQLTERARDVQRLLKRSDRTTDGELAVDDARAVFFRGVLQ